MSKIDNTGNDFDLEELNNILNDGISAKHPYIDGEKQYHIIQINENPRKEYIYENDKWHHRSSRKSWVFDSFVELGNHINYKNK